MSAPLTISLDDPRLEPYRNLTDTNLTRWRHQFVVEGEKLVQRLLASRLEVVSIVVDQRSWARLPDGLPPAVDVLVVGDGEVPKLIGFNFHRGMLACALRPPAARLESLLHTDSSRRTLIVCPQLDDPENLGAILRIGAAFGVAGVLVGARAPDPLSRRVLRVSMGAALELPVVRSADLDRDFALLRSAGFDTIATVLNPEAQKLADTLPAARQAIVLGSEGHGLDSRWIAACDRQITIGMQPRVDSLNVAVAAGIFLYHLTQNPAPSSGIR
ncbi:MAG: RNA methyltransferase [Planctomycetaceae bacterium]|nr:RNA methyltransferase [Planctomycetaceae bacterium]